MPDYDAQVSSPDITVGIIGGGFIFTGIIGLFGLFFLADIKIPSAMILFGIILIVVESLLCKAPEESQSEKEKII